MESSVHSKEHQQQVDKLENFVNSIRTAMLTSINEETDMLVSRPMLVSHFDKDNRTLWFFTNKTSNKVKQLRSGEIDNRVCVTFTDTTNQHYVSISGRAQIVDDRSLIKKWWKTDHAPLFEKGADDPNLTLVKVNCSEAQYWDTKENKLETMWHAVKDTITGKHHIPHHEHATVPLETK